MYITPVLRRFTKSDQLYSTAVQPYPVKSPLPIVKFDRRVPVSSWIQKNNAVSSWICRILLSNNAGQYIFKANVPRGFRLFDFASMQDRLLAAWLLNVLVDACTSTVHMYAATYCS